MRDNILKDVYAQDKVELSSIEVNLSVYDDIKKGMIEANRGAMKAIDLANAAKKPAADSLKLNLDLLNKFENFIQKIKELGIQNAQPEVEKGVLQVKENIKTIESVINALNKI